MKTHYLLRVAIAFDMAVQALFRFGIPGVTISSRAGTAKARGHRWGCVLCWLLDRTPGFRTEGGHCQEAIKNDRIRAQAVLDSLKDY